MKLKHVLRTYRHLATYRASLSVDDIQLLGEMRKAILADLCKCNEEDEAEEECCKPSKWKKAKKHTSPIVALELFLSGIATMLDNGELDNLCDSKVTGVLVELAYNLGISEEGVEGSETCKELSDDILRVLEMSVDD